MVDIDADRAFEEWWTDNVAHGNVARMRHRDTWHAAVAWATAAMTETCEFGHKFAWLPDHPRNNQGYKVCPHCLLIGLKRAREDAEQAIERERRAAQPEPHADLVRSAESVWSKWNEDDDDFRHMHEVMAAFAAECAAEWRRRAEAAERAYMATVASRQVYRERAEAAEQELTKIREVLRDIDYASLPDDYPVSKIARVRMTTLNERTKQGLAEIGRYEAAEQALAEEREACAKVADEKAANSVFLSETASEDISPLHGAAAEAAISIAATIRARKGGEETS